MSKEMPNEIYVERNMNSFYDGFDEEPQHIRLTKYIRADLPVVIPEGWQLVPKEPTAKQLNFTTAFALSARILGDYGWTDYIGDLYKAMLSAAPEPPQERK